MITDKNNIVIEIGDIVKIENSPIKSDNATYVVGQDGTSRNYSSSDLTMYKVAKNKNGYSLSKSSYNIAFYPLCNFSSKYHYTREEMNAATIEIILKSDSNAFTLVKSNDDYETEETEQTYFRAVIKCGDKEIEDISYSANQKEKMCAFFSNITLKQDETIEIIKQDHTWGYYYKNISYKLESTKPVEEQKEQPQEKKNITKETTTEDNKNNLHYDIKEDTDTRNNDKIFVVKIEEKLSKEEYIKVNQYINSLGGYYSKFKHGFIFKNNPTNLLSGTITEVQQEQEKPTEQKQQQEEVKETPKQNIIEYDIEQSENNQKKPIWLVKVKSNVSKDEFTKIKQNFATLKGFYSGLYSGFIFKYDPTEKIKSPA